MTINKVGVKDTEEGIDDGEDGPMLVDGEPETVVGSFVVGGGAGAEHGSPLTNIGPYSP